MTSYTVDIIEMLSAIFDRCDVWYHTLRERTQSKGVLDLGAQENIWAVQTFRG